MKRDYPPRPIVSVGAIVIDNNRALIVRRGTEPSKGAWSVPGGAVELGETLRQAVAREALEETGLIVEPRVVVNVSDGIYHDARGRIQYHYIFIDFRCRVVAGEPHPGSDATDVRWVDEAELDRLPMSQTAQQVLRSVLSSLDVG